MPGPKERVLADPSWTALEAWVWEKLQAGDIADIDRYEDEQGQLPPADPNKGEGWHDGRRHLSARFLEAIVLTEPFREALHRKGVRIEGAWFCEEIDLELAVVTCVFWLDRCRFEQPLRLAHLKAESNVTFDSSVFADHVDMQGARIRGNLFLRGVTGLRSFTFRTARIDGLLHSAGAKIKGPVDMNGITVGLALFLGSTREIPGGDSEFTEVNLIGAKVGGQVNLNGATVKGMLAIDGASIKHDLLMGSNQGASERQAEFGSVSMRGTRIRGQLGLVGARINGALAIDRAEIGQDLVMHTDLSTSKFRAFYKDVNLRGVTVQGQINLTGTEVKRTVVAIASKIEGDVFLGGATIGEVDLHGAQIRGELNFVRLTPDWRNEEIASELNLRNASCDAVQDGGELGVWPENLELDGFTYQRFGGLGADPETDVARRRSNWFISWLAKDRSYSPQPYHQCAKVLREMGHPEMANDILHESRERERHEIWAPWPYKGRGARARFGRSLHWLKCMLAGSHPFPWYEEVHRSLRWLGLSLLAFLVGYGYGTRLLWRPLAWAVLTVGIGVGITYSSASGFPDSSFWWRTFFSVDMLLPIVELSREHTLVQAGLDGLAYGWFVIQRLFGWVLALFLIAGLTGLTR